MSLPSSQLSEQAARADEHHAEIQREDAERLHGRRQQRHFAAHVALLLLIVARAHSMAAGARGRYDWGIPESVLARVRAIPKVLARVRAIPKARPGRPTGASGIAAALAAAGAGGMLLDDERAA